MVSWIYSGPLFWQIVSGITTTDQSGRMAGKVVRVPGKCAAVFISREEHPNLSKLSTDRKNSKYS